MTTSTSGFLTSLITNLVIFLVLVVVYVILVKNVKNSVIYFAGRFLRKEEVPGARQERGMFDWAVRAYRATDDELVEKAGLDAVVFLKIFSTGTKIFLACALYCIVIEIPVNVTGGYYADYNSSHPDHPLAFDNFDKMSMGNIPKGSARFWTHIIAAYWVTLAVFFFLHQTYKDVVELRARYEATRKARPQQYTCLVTDIPENPGGLSREGQVESFFSKLHPACYAGSYVVADYKKAEKLYADLDKARRKLIHAEAVYERSQTNPKTPGGKRPEHKTGLLGLMGPKVDSITYWSEQVKELSAKLLDEQQVVRGEKARKAAMVFFNSRAVATMASQSLHPKKAQTWNVIPAPEPRELIWTNMTIRWWERFMRQAAVYAITFLIIFFYLIPIAFVSALSTLDNLKKTLPFLKPIFNVGVVKAILQAYLPQLALIVFLAILPALLMFLSKQEGIISTSHQIRAASGKYFYFMVFNVFLGVTVAGSFFSQLKQMADNPKDIPNILGSSLPQQATFFITYIMLQTFIGYGLELSRVVPWVIWKVKARFLAVTEEEHRDAWAPGGFTYHTAVPNHLLIALLGLCYSVIAPIILPFAILYFFLGHLIYRHGALNIYIPNYESAGRMYPHIHRRIVAALFVAQITMLGYFGLQQFKPTPALIPLPILTLVFHLYTSKRFEGNFKVTPLEVAVQEVTEVPSLADVQHAYAPDCMKDPKEIWVKEGVESKEGSKAHQAVDQMEAGLLTSKQ